MAWRDGWDTLVQRIGDRLFLLRDRIDRLSPPSWRDVASSAGGRVDWKRLGSWSGMREMLRERPGVVGAGCIAITALSLGIATLGSDRRAYPDVWFYDVGTRELFAVSGRTQPPVEPPSGATLADGAAGGVRAYVFACGSCADEGSRFVGYLERLSPQVHRVLQDEEAAPTEDPGAYERWVVEGHLVASPDRPEEWVGRQTEGGQAIADSAYARCGEGRAPEACLP